MKKYRMKKRKTEKKLTRNFKTPASQFAGVGQRIKFRFYLYIRHHQPARRSQPTGWGEKSAIKQKQNRN